MHLDHATLRAKLKTELTQTRETLMQATASADTVTLDQSSVGRLSRMDALQQQAMALGLQERIATRIRRIEAALVRFDAGTYGKCCQCRTEIEPDRLQADATAVFCANCQADREEQRKG
jgi:DnaK suppressor protein